jgi:hypothetical protein
MTIHSILGAIVIGLVIGVVARFVLPGKQPIPILADDPGRYRVGVPRHCVGTGHGHSD